MPLTLRILILLKIILSGFRPCIVKSKGSSPVAKLGRQTYGKLGGNLLPIWMRTIMSKVPKKKLVAKKIFICKCVFYWPECGWTRLFVLILEPFSWNFSKSKKAPPPESLAPTKDALYLHFDRVNYQCWQWKMALNFHHELFEPTDHG